MPANVTEPDVLKRFLNRLIEELDIVLGYRGNSAYITQADLEDSTATLGTIVQDILANTESIADSATAIESLAKDLESLTSTVSDNAQAISDIGTVLASTTLSTTYHDFDDIAYATLEGNNEFNTLGSNLTNAPYTPIGGETYYNFINSVVTANAGVVQVLRAYSTTTLVPTTYFRIGDDWTKAVALGWT